MAPALFWCPSGAPLAAAPSPKGATCRAEEPSSCTAASPTPPATAACGASGGTAAAPGACRTNGGPPCLPFTVPPPSSSSARRLAQVFNIVVMPGPLSFPLRYYLIRPARDPDAGGGPVGPGHARCAEAPRGTPAQGGGGSAAAGEVATSGQAHVRTPSGSEVPKKGQEGDRQFKRKNSFPPPGAPGGPKSAPRGPHRPPRSPQDAPKPPRGPQEAPKRLPEAPKRPPRGLKTAFQKPPRGVTRNPGTVAGWALGQ